MKKQIITAAFIHCALASFAQAPQAIPYQAIARNSSGTIVASSPVGLRFTVRDNSPSGTVLYTETHTPTTSDQGSFNVNIGQGSVISGTFASINWGVNAKYLQVELDVTGGTTYVNMGTQQLLSVPYALYAESAGGSGSWADSAGMLHNTNATKRVGIGTSNPLARLHVADSSIVFTGPTVPGSSLSSVPVTGTGSRFMWNPQNSSLRAGFAYGTQWDADSIGAMSVALGDGPTAIGNSAIALGHLSRANANNTVAIGDSATATAPWATAMGRHAKATAQQSMALGSNSLANATAAIAIGNKAQALSPSSVALGNNALSSGSTTPGVAIGTNVSASAGAVSIGYNNTADSFSYAVGFSNDAEGGISIGRESYSTNGGVAIGWGAYATDSAVAINAHAENGSFAAARGEAYGLKSIALGLFNTAYGNYSVALGSTSQSYGDHSFAIGYLSSVYGNNSFALGHFAHASGNNSFAIGFNTANNYHSGSFAIGDGDMMSVSPAQNSADNQMVMRFTNGYQLHTYWGIGTEIVPGGNAWSVISDKRKKENFKPIDGNALLSKIAGMQLSTWNYKGQDPKTFRHYGPMAQDFYAAFGNDGIGTIGNDTTINQADMAGVTFTAVQALAKKADDIAAANAQLEARVNALMTEEKNYTIQNNQLKAELQQSNREILSRLDALEATTRKTHSATR